MAISEITYWWQDNHTQRERERENLHKERVWFSGLCNAWKKKAHIYPSQLTEYQLHGVPTWAIRVSKTHEIMRIFTTANKHKREVKPH
jgi:hypothetical protein